MLIRPATESDVESLFEVRTSVAQNFQSREELAGLGVTPESIAGMLLATSRAWIAEEDGRALAFSMADAEQGTVFAMFVRPEHEGKGLGRALMKEAETWLFSQGWPEIWLLTGSDPGLRAVGFYLHLGWQAVGLEDDGQTRYIKRRSSEDTVVRAAAPSDVQAITDIYNHYVTETVVTFEEEPIDAAEMSRRMQEVRSASLPWLVAEEGGKVAGYAYATKWRARSGYRFSAEITVYLAPTHGGRGIGSKLYGELFTILQARGVHAVMGGIALPNDASVALHEKFGLRKVAHFAEVGFKFDRWIDVGYWQRTF